MFYETAKGNHGLPHNPFKACVVPRPIGWITSIDGEGRVNLAPYSFFNAVASDPPMLMFATNGRKAGERRDKDSLANIAETGAFVTNLVTWDLKEQMVLTSAPLPHGEAENDLAGLTLAPSRMIAPPRVAKAPINLECKLWRIVELPGGAAGERNTMVLGEVVGVHIADGIIVDGLVNLALCKPVARLGYIQYAAAETIFDMKRPPGGG